MKGVEQPKEEVVWAHGWKIVRQQGEGTPAVLMNDLLRWQNNLYWGIQKNEIITVAEIVYSKSSMHLSKFFCRCKIDTQKEAEHDNSVCELRVCCAHGFFLFIVSVSFVPLNLLFLGAV